MHKFRTRIALTALAASTLTISGCKSEVKVIGPEPVTEQAAAAVMDSAQKTWTSMDAGKFDALYAGKFTAFDVDAPDRIETSDAMHEVNVRFSTMKYDAVSTPDREIQILGPDAFVASGIAHFTTSFGEGEPGNIRYTEVFQKQSDGSWKIVHEHLSYPPKAAQ